MPEVTSAVVRWTSPRRRRSPSSTFGTLVRGISPCARKMLANALALVAAGLDRQPAAVLDAAGVDGRRRPETLAVDELVRLAEALRGPD